MSTGPLPTLKKHLFYSFLGGVATAFGATVGFAIVVWVLTFALGHLEWVPIVGHLLANIVSATNQALQKH